MFLFSYSLHFLTFPTFSNYLQFFFYSILFHWSSLFLKQQMAKNSCCDKSNVFFFLFWNVLFLIVYLFTFHLFYSQFSLGNHRLRLCHWLLWHLHRMILCSLPVGTIIDNNRRRLSILSVWSFLLAWVLLWYSCFHSVVDLLFSLGFDHFVFLWWIYLQMLFELCIFCPLPLRSFHYRSFCVVHHLPYRFESRWGFPRGLLLYASD